MVRIVRAPKRIQIMLCVDSSVAPEMSRGAGKTGEMGGLVDGLAPRKREFPCKPAFRNFSGTMNLQPSSERLAERGIFRLSSNCRMKMEFFFRGTCNDCLAR